MYLAGKIPIEDESFKGVLRMILTLRMNVQDRTKYLKQESHFVRVEDLVKMKAGTDLGSIYSYFNIFYRYSRRH